MNTPLPINAGIKIISDDTFEFDGVVYRNYSLLSKIDKLRNLLSTSTIISGTPNPNEKSWGFLLSDGSFVISKNKNKYTTGVLYCISRKRYELLHLWHSGILLQEFSKNQ